MRLPSAGLGVVRGAEGAIDQDRRAMCRAASDATESLMATSGAQSRMMRARRATRHNFKSRAIVSLGLLRQSRSIRYGSGIVWGDGIPERFIGKAPRLWPAQALLDLAVTHGVSPGQYRG